MTTLPDIATDLSGRAKWIATAGWFILLLSAGSALLPLYGKAHSSLIIGSLLVLAGLTEIFAGTLRHETRRLAILAGVLTTVAGVLFATDNATHFLSTISIIAGWLFLRSLVLIRAAWLERGSVRTWTGIAAATDLVLALILAVGLSIATLIVSLFGATPPMIASFAWILAASFIATAMLLLEVAASARASEDV
ncbi:hypothetical protein [Sphingomonas sp.]|uniref:hypothetical protein n=1 Tax=Sphingomonas sp. TaxID=28214 RepID=UPI00286C7103|nr:hypothetical protein [Sphingomonas sp.]